MTAEGAAAGARTFLIADIRGYTAYTAEHGDDAAATLARQFADICRDVVEAHEGFLIELRGDEALCAFASARQALRAALHMQERFKAELARGVGIGIDSGEAIAVDDGFRGTALNLAARLCAQAKPGQVIASEAAIHLAAHVDGIAYVEPRTIKLKGYDTPVRAVDVVAEGTAPRRASAVRRRARDRRVLAGGLVALVVIALGTVALSGAFSPKPGAPASATATPLIAGGSPASSSAVSSAVSATPLGSARNSAPPTPPASDGPIPTDQLPALAFLDPATGAVTSAQAAIPNQTDLSTFTDGAFWQLGVTPLAFYKIDPATHAVSNAISIPPDLQGGVAIADGTLWIADGTKPRVVAIDGTTGSIVHDFFFGDGPTDGTLSQGVAVGAGSVWVSLPFAGEVLRLDPATGEVQKRIDIPTVEVLAFGNGAIWSTGNGKMSRIDPVTNEVTFRTELNVGRNLPYMTFSPNAVWTADEADGTVYKVDRSGQVVAHYQVGAGARALQYMDGKVWVGAGDDGSVSSIDANTGRLSTYPIGHEVTTLAAGGGEVMIGVGPSPEEILLALPGHVLRVALPNDVLQSPVPDPAVNPYQGNRMVLYATCARLLDYGDTAGADSYNLRPEVAAAMPEVSADGLTYTFTIRPGFAFSPPSNEPLTAETYRYSIQRALSAGVGDEGTRAIESWSDIAGATDYHDGKADHVTGLQADGDKLTITLTAPSIDFLERLALPFSCPVPLGTPAVPALDPTTPVANSGPYYLAVHGGAEYAILKKNPNYGGSRPQNYDAIALRFGIAPGESAALVDEGRADVAIGDIALQAGSDISTAYGPDSDAAKQGDQRWYPIPYPGVDYIVLNPNGKLTGDQTVRHALALALDRASVAQSYSEPPAEQLLGSAFLGSDEVIDELIGPDPTGAQALLAGRAGSIRMAVLKDCDVCLDSANAIKSSLATIGITLDLVEDVYPRDAASDPSSKIDINADYAQPNYPDAVALLTNIVDLAPAGWMSDEQQAQVDALSSLSGDERAQAAATFAHELVEDGLIIPWGSPIDGVYFGPSVGCRTVIAGIMNVDLAALCPAAPEG